MPDHRYEVDLTIRDASGQSATRSVEYSTPQPTVDEAVKELRQRLTEAAPKQIHAVSDQN